MTGSFERIPSDDERASNMPPKYGISPEGALRGGIMRGLARYVLGGTLQEEGRPATGSSGGASNETDLKDSEIKYEHGIIPAPVHARIVTVIEPLKPAIYSRARTEFREKYFRERSEASQDHRY